MEATKRETFREMHERHQKEFNEFPIQFAFGNKQFEEAMAKWGLSVYDTKEIIGIGAGGFIRKTDRDAFIEMMTRQRLEESKAMQDDEYLYDMFVYEMWNHEYGYTLDPEEVLEACGFTMAQVRKNKRLHAAWQRAHQKVIADAEAWEAQQAAALT